MARLCASVISYMAFSLFLICPSIGAFGIPSIGAFCISWVSSRNIFFFFFFFFFFCKMKVSCHIYFCLNFKESRSANRIISSGHLVYNVGQAKRNGFLEHVRPAKTDKTARMRSLISLRCALYECPLTQTFFLQTEKVVYNWAETKADYSAQIQRSPFTWHGPCDRHWIEIIFVMASSARICQHESERMWRVILMGLSKSCGNSKSTKS